MASARKKFPNPRGVGRTDLYRGFIAGVLDGSITATRLHESRNPQGHTELEYDDPNGPGQGNQAARIGAGRDPT